MQGYATQIAQLNGQIKLAEQAGQTPNEMLDRRDDLLGQFEAGQLEAIFQGCDSHQKERPQLRLPLPDALAQREVLLTRTPKFKKDAVGERSHFVELRIDRFAKRVAPFDCNWAFAGNGLSRQLSERPYR